MNKVNKVNKVNEVNERRPIRGERRVRNDARAPQGFRN